MMLLASCKMNYLCIFLIVFTYCYATETPNRPIVNVKEGAVQGISRISAQGKEYYAFEGIPYAEPPVGQNRFKESVPVKPWSGIWPADTPGSECLQYAHITIPNEEAVHGQEDCLFVNVYTPKLPADEYDEDLLNVVIYIHGGAFMFGAGHFYGPKYLVDRNVVFVTVNYRLGILGFLTTGDSLVPGNNGLKDQTLALKWVQRNIRAFGGDPNSVTLTGTSAGGASVHYHYLSPLSAGLFQRGISFSGTSLCPWAFTENMEQKTRRLAAFVGCDQSSSEELVNCLRSRPARQIVAQTEHFQPWLYAPFSPFGPIAEKSSDGAFITQHPMQILKSGKIQDIPWITTVTSEEGLYPMAEFIANKEYLSDLNNQFIELATHVLDYNYTVVPREKIPEVGEKIRRFYFGDEPINENVNKQLIKLASDRHFFIPAEKAARLQAAKNKSPVYFHYFSYRGAHSLTEVFAHNNIDYGTSHGDDVAFIIDAYYSKTDETPSDREMTQLLLDTFSNYFRTGKPKVPSKFGISWPAVSPKDKLLKYLHIFNPNTWKIETTEDIGNIQFWDSLPIQEPLESSGKITDEL